MLETIFLFIVNSPCSLKPKHIDVIITSFAEVDRNIKTSRGIRHLWRSLYRHFLEACSQNFLRRHGTKLIYRLLTFFPSVGCCKKHSVGLPEDENCGRKDFLHENSGYQCQNSNFFINIGLRTMSLSENVYTINLF